MDAAVVKVHTAELMQMNTPFFLWLGLPSTLLQKLFKNGRILKLKMMILQKPSDFPAPSFPQTQIQDDLQFFLAHCGWKTFDAFHSENFVYLRHR